MHHPDEEWNIRRPETFRMVINILHDDHATSHFRENDYVKRNGGDEADREQCEGVRVPDGVLVIIVIENYDGHSDEHCVRHEEDENEKVEGLTQLLISQFQLLNVMVHKAQSCHRVKVFHVIGQVLKVMFPLNLL